MRQREPEQSTWMLKVDMEGHQTLLLLSNYYSLWQMMKLNSAGFMAAPPAAPVSPQGPIVSPPLFVKTGSLPIWRATGDRKCLSTNLFQPSSENSWPAPAPMPWYLQTRPGAAPWDLHEWSPREGPTNPASRRPVLQQCTDILALILALCVSSQPQAAQC